MGSDVCIRTDSSDKLDYLIGFLPRSVVRDQWIAEDVSDCNSQAEVRGQGARFTAFFGSLSLDPWGAHAMSALHRMV